MLSSLNSLGLEADLKRAEEKKIRAGRGKMRGRKYRGKKSLLIVIGKDEGLGRVDNIPGVDVVKYDKLDVQMLAPGTHPGRLTVYTESALKGIDEFFGLNDGKP